MIRIVLPYHLRTLAQVQGEVHLEMEGKVTIAAVLDALEQQYPMLRGTIRHHQSKKRRAFLRFFACEEDYSQQPPETILPEKISSGQEPFLIVGALAGG
ncbi:MAG: MoaD/ThiS family protein [Candidatus Omnitrophica bacterium]|nr:MoaD/ThiS family protein [Saprospiraceae bacterium]MCB9748341.1 MoaD/ThiS family protein [Candidatus Omnitrophota bacterium]